MQAQMTQVRSPRYSDAKDGYLDRFLEDGTASTYSSAYRNIIKDPVQLNQDSQNILQGIFSQ